MAFQAFFPIISLRMDDQTLVRLVFVQNGPVSLVAIDTAILVLCDAIPFSNIMKVVQILVTRQAGIGWGSGGLRCGRGLG